jgi:hypothetical protein
MAHVPNQIYMAHVPNQILHGSRAKPNIHGSRAKPNIHGSRAKPNIHGSRFKPNIHGSRAKPNITWLTCQTNYCMAQVPNQIYMAPHAKPSIKWLTCQTKYSSRLTHVKLIRVIGSSEKSSITLGSTAKVSIIYVISRIIVLETLFPLRKYFQDRVCHKYRCNIWGKKLKDDITMCP